jgi:hypothetical protein
MLQISLVLLLLVSGKATAFVPPIPIGEVEPRSFLHHQTSGSIAITLKVSSSPIVDSTKTIEDLKFEIDNEIKSTQRGLSASPEQRTKIDSLVQSLESLCPYEEPARMPEMEGKWIVDYTTAPPPSNGKLGPFEGIARQIIDLDSGTYVNYLSVPGDIEKEFLSARLEATFEEWDGNLLPDDQINEANSESDDDDVPTDTVSKEPPMPTKLLQSISSIFQRQDESIQKSAPDYGANSWKVDFKTLTIKLFGFKVLEKSFDEGTSRVWKMSYLDKDGTRVVRAGRTGRDKDAMLFYMQRESN